MLRRQDVPIITARVLHGILSCSRLFGFLFFTYGNDKYGLIILEDNRKWWRCLHLLHRIMCVIAVSYFFSDRFDGFNCIVQNAFQCVRVVVFIIWIIKQQFFMSPKVISLANKMLKLFRRVRCLSNQKRVGFGGGRELVLLMLILSFRIYDFASILTLFHRQYKSNIVAPNFYAWFFFYTVCSLQVVVNFTFLWYLSLGELYAEFNEIMKSDGINSRNLKFDVYLEVFRKIHEISTLFNKIYYSHIFVYVFSSALYVGDMTYRMIISQSFGHPLVLIGILKIILEHKLFCTAVERIFKELGNTRLIISELFMVTDTKESDQAVSIMRK